MLSEVLGVELHSHHHMEGCQMQSKRLSHAQSKQQQCNRMRILHEPNDMNNAKHNQTGSTASDPTTM
jgi:hypothetical protein